MTKKGTYLYQERKGAQIHLPLDLQIISLQVKRYVSRQKPSHDRTFRMGPILLCLETRPIAELNIVCEQAHGV